ncbi:MAG: hypothetical protein EI684_21370 [Candidatus Viridilinea halotolerans]|uniref:Uncharacterized protein n=1 Tax=Candidatus Viridilinea halotolerans TaxID=2491704 RepID=A0A426TRI2_9CHLR|nr:MAG: hypothetical protein EI684_21370 [Candidatus Viridilinea halotolerans]
MQNSRELPAPRREPPPRQATYELEIAIVGVGAVTALYVWAMRGLDTAPGALLGHGLGVVGFLLMLATETLYSLRKRSRGRPRGRLSTWLQWHIVMGIVGSYMVLLHTAWRFNGLAGVVTLLTAVVVLSGFVGRYVYTAIPRTVDGAELSLAELEMQLAVSATRLESLARPGAAPSAVALTSLLASPASLPCGPLVALLARPLLAWRDRSARRRILAALGTLDQATATEVSRLLAERQRLLRQVASLATARRLLALWHTVHLPLGVALFVLAFVHIGAALYYATLLR